MTIMDSSGNIFLRGESGKERNVMQVQFGISYSTLQPKGKTVTKVTVSPGYIGNVDTFYFDGDEKLLFQHIMNREVFPNLNKTYLKYFDSVKKTSVSTFVDYVIANYFIKLAGFTFPVIEIEEGKPK